MTAILGRAQTGFDQTTINHYIVHTLYCPQRVIVVHVGYIGGCRRTLGAWNLTSIVSVKGWKPYNQSFHFGLLPAYAVLGLITTLWIFPYLPKYSCFFRIWKKKTKRKIYTQSETADNGFHSPLGRPIWAASPQQTPDSFAQLEHSPNVYDSRWFSACAADPVVVSRLSVARSGRTNKAISINRITISGGFDFYLLLGQWRKIRWIFRISFPARRTQLILIGTDSVPTEPTNLIATGAWIKVQVVNFEWFHAQGTLDLFVATMIKHIHGYCKFQINRPCWMKLFGFFSIQHQHHWSRFSKAWLAATRLHYLSVKKFNKFRIDFDPFFSLLSAYPTDASAQNYKLNEQSFVVDLLFYFHDVDALSNCRLLIWIQVCLCCTQKLNFPVGYLEI